MEAVIKVGIFMARSSERMCAFLEAVQRVDLEQDRNVFVPSAVGRPDQFRRVTLPSKASSGDYKST